LLAAVLSVTGLFGMTAYSVSKRMKELSIRVALGAGSARLVAAAVYRPLVLVAIGSTAGYLLGRLAGPSLAQIVYQARSDDPLVAIGVVITVLVLTILAVWGPVRRALNVDPALLLRSD